MNKALFERMSEAQSHSPETLAMDDLKERLRKVEGSVEYGADPGGTVTCWHRNPDGLEALAHIEALEQRVSELEEALTPSAKTKAAYSCEFEFSVGIAHPRLGSEWRSVMVPWTTIKEIMAAIRAHAALNREPNP